LVYNVSMADAQNRALLGKRDTTLYRADPWRVEWFNEGVAAPDTEVTETLLRTLTPNTWTLLSPPKKPASNHDWGTSVYDSDRDRIILFSGGHSAHCGNEVDEYTIATNRWKISYVPEWPLEETYNSGLPFLFSFSGRPMVTHSYDNYAYDTIVHKMLYIKPNYTFFYNPSVADWDSVIPNPSLFTTDYHHIAVNRTKHGSLAWVRQGSSGAYALYALDYDSLRWRLLPRTGAVLPSCYGDNGGGAYDSKRDRFVMVYCSGTTDPQVVSYDFATGVATALTPANNAIARTSYMRECVYMPEFDRIIFGAEQNGKLLAFNCESNEWEVLDVVRPTTVLSPNTRGTGFMLDTKRGLLWYHEANSMKTSVIKLTSAVFPSGSYTEKKSDKAKTYLKISPNPFNPSTSVMFSLPVAGNVTLAIYTPDGRIVKELLQSTRTEAGSHAIKLDGKELTSGAYIVKLECGNMRLQKKLVMLK
ncbi:MAG: T9SS type A sorting domain-containing protein, partial [Fibrobacteres bacterium]|nr:T9SS type A sorting domain-containing protein [Fibrobacterota bacterium]